MADLFNESWYLSQNPDIKAAVEAGLISAREHFELHGKTEGRSPGPLFDPQHYLNQNPDIKAAVEAGLLNAYDHFVNYGMHESRSPMSLFNVEFYLQQNPDVKAAVDAGLLSAVEHFLSFGQNEARYIDPFINLGAYLNANPDVAGATGISALEHLMQYGVSEGRDLGNGIILSVFADDPKFKDALEGGDIAGAMSRVEDVAPFLPTFEPAPNWTAPANTPIPTDFTPPEGTKLVVPPTVTVPEGTTLPDTFEPVEPGPGPGPDPDPTTTFTVNVKETDGTITFGGNAKGAITINVDADQNATFTRAGVEANKQVSDFDEKTISVPESETTTLLGSGADVKHLGLALQNAGVSLSSTKGSNLLVDPNHISGEKKLKTLEIDASGDSSLNLGNSKLGSGGVGYFLESVNVTGGESGDTLNISTLYFGSENTKFDSTKYAGAVTLDAYVYHGSPAHADWSIKFGSGNDVLHLLNDPGTPWDVPSVHSKIDGGEGNNTLVLDQALYPFWSSPSTPHKNDSTVTNFQILRTEAVENRTYESTLLGNEFTDIVLTGSAQENITINGFQNVTFDAGSADITIGGGDDNEKKTFKVVSDANPASAVTTVATINNYKEGDVIDLTGVTHAYLDVQTRIYNGASDWASNLGIEDDATVIKLLNSASDTDGSSSPLLALSDTYKEGTTIKIKMLAAQTDLQEVAAILKWSSEPGLTLLSNIADNAVINAASHSLDANILMTGGSGSQTLISGAGNDVMNGGDGADTFVFEGNFGTDIIIDFEQNSDKIDLSAFNINFDSLAVDNTSTELTEITGEGLAGTIYLAGNFTLTASDFDFGPGSPG